ncbi:hypothetical protein [uncultured Bacteroides sp.]|uniref:hypothetical protein n=1 Tax=uncultured Bacteroides sp. TaxID=162156 RepID=UPI0025EDD9D9|nr:hypothetical protein [uncultured Bacteroides sp.]
MWSILDTSLINASAGREGVSFVETMIVYNQMTHFFVPKFPLLFVISYSSFILGVKRVRMLTRNRAIVIVSGVLNYLFFASSMALMMLAMQMEGERGNMEHYTSTWLFLLYVLFFIGGVNFVCLYIWGASEPITSPSPKGKLNVLNYGIKVGNLMWIGALISIVMGIALNCVGKILLLSPIIPVVAGGSSVVLLFFYIKYSVFRLKDAGVSLLWLVCVIVVYLLLLGLKLWLNVYKMGYVTLCYNTIFSIITSFFVLAQFALFLLPTKNCEPCD